MLQEINGVSRADARIQPFVFNSGRTVDNVILVRCTFPVLDVHLSNLARLVGVVVETTLGTWLPCLRFGESGSTQYVANTMPRDVDAVISLKHYSELRFAVPQAKS